MDSGTLDETCDRIAALLGVDPETIMVERGSSRISLSHGQARRLMVLAETTDYETLLDIVHAFAATLPLDHKDRPGALRAAEVLKHYYAKP